VNATRLAAAGAKDLLLAAEAVFASAVYHTEMPEDFAAAVDALRQRLIGTFRALHCRGPRWRHPDVDPIVFPQNLRPDVSFKAVSERESMHGHVGASAVHIACSIGEKVLTAIRQGGANTADCSIRPNDFPQIQARLRGLAFPTPGQFQGQCQEIRCAIDRELKRAEDRVEDRLPVLAGTPQMVHPGGAGQTDTGPDIQKQIRKKSPYKEMQTNAFLKAVDKGLKQGKTRVEVAEEFAKRCVDDVENPEAHRKLVQALLRRIQPSRLRKQ
jgi:hypothetical protein